MTLNSGDYGIPGSFTQSLRPVKHLSQHVCTIAMYNQDMRRQLQTHHFLHRLNDDFVQCAVYDSDAATARLIGIEYILSDRLYEGLPPEEQRLWHSHAYEVKSGQWFQPRIPEIVAKHDLKSIAKTYGKFWCTWQTESGDKLPMGVPALMMSPQAVEPGIINRDVMRGRDEKYAVSSDTLRAGRAEIAEPEWINPMADYWKQQCMYLKVDVVPVDMKRRAPFP